MSAAGTTTTGARPDLRSVGCGHARGEGSRMDEVTTVYTDGACIGNPGPGGWAWAVPEGAHASGADPQTTNQRMEIRAALEAVRVAARPVDRRERLDVRRELLQQPLVREVGSQRLADVGEEAGASTRTSGDRSSTQFHEREREIEFRWVKGHSGDVMNDVVDRLATEAAARQEGRSGSEPPDRPRRGRRSARPRRPPGASRRTPPRPATASSCSGIGRPSSGATATTRSPRRCATG